MRKRSELAMEKRCGRPWLLLCLLPYLMLSLLSGTSHNHAPSRSPHALSSHPLTDSSSARSFASTAAEPASHSASHGASQADSASERASAYSECLACHWASGTLALVAASARAQAPPPLALLWPRTASSPSGDARGGRSARGPPLS